MLAESGRPNCGRATSHVGWRVDNDEERDIEVEFFNQEVTYTLWGSGRSTWYKEILDKVRDKYPQAKVRHVQDMRDVDGRGTRRASRVLRKQSFANRGTAGRLRLRLRLARAIGTAESAYRRCCIRGGSCASCAAEAEAEAVADANGGEHAAPTSAPSASPIPSVRLRRLRSCIGG